MHIKILELYAGEKNNGPQLGGNSEPLVRVWMREPCCLSGIRRRGLFFSTVCVWGMVFVCVVCSIGVCVYVVCVLCSMWCVCGVIMVMGGTGKWVLRSNWVLSC